MVQCKNNVARYCVIVLSVQSTLQWRHNWRDGVSNHQPHGCLLNRSFRRRSKKTSKLRITGLCVGNSPGPMNSPHKWPVTRKMFPFDDVVMRLHYIYRFQILSAIISTFTVETLYSTIYYSKYFIELNFVYTICCPLNSQKTPHTSPFRASYGVSFMSTSTEIDRVIKGFYRTKITRFGA